MNKEILTIVSYGKTVNTITSNVYRFLSIQLFKCKKYKWSRNPVNGLYHFEFTITDNTKYIFDNIIF